MEQLDFFAIDRVVREREQEANARVDGVIQEQVRRARRMIFARAGMALTMRRSQKNS